MEKDKHYLRVGSFVLLTIFAAVVFSVWLVGMHSKSLYMHYRMHFTESVSGLEIGSPVKFRGVQVGKVDQLAIDAQDTRLIEVEASILKTAPIKTDTVAVLKLQGITGSVYIELTGKDPQAADLVSENDKKSIVGSQIAEIPTEPSTLNTLMEKLTHMTNQADKLFSDKNVGSINDMVKNLDKASQNINEATQEVKENPSKLIFSSKGKKKDKDNN